MTFTDSHSRVDENVTVGSCMINRLHFANDWVLLYRLVNRAFNIRLIVFFTACDHDGMKTSTKNTKEIGLCRNPRKCMLKVSAIPL